MDSGWGWSNQRPWRLGVRQSPDNSSTARQAPHQSDSCKRSHSQTRRVWSLWTKTPGPVAKSRFVLSSLDQGGLTRRVAIVALEPRRQWRQVAQHLAVANGQAFSPSLRLQPALILCFAFSLNDAYASRRKNLASHYLEASAEPCSVPVRGCILFCTLLCTLSCTLFCPQWLSSQVVMHHQRHSRRLCVYLISCARCPSRFGVTRSPLGRAPLQHLHPTSHHNPNLSRDHLPFDLILPAEITPHTCTHHPKSLVKVLVHVCC